MNDICSPFTVRQDGNAGQVIVGPDGTILAWTTDSRLALVICRLLTENEGLLDRP